MEETLEIEAIIIYNEKLFKKAIKNKIVMRIIQNTTHISIQLPLIISLRHECTKEGV